MKEFTYLLFIVCIFLAPFITLFATIIINKRIHTKPQKVRRKKLTLILCVLVFLLLIMSATYLFWCDGKEDYIRFLKETFLTRGFICLMIIFVILFFYGYFRKDKLNNHSRNHL